MLGLCFKYYVNLSSKPAVNNRQYQDFFSGKTKKLCFLMQQSVGGQLATRPGFSEDALGPGRLPIERA